MPYDIHHYHETLGREIMALLHSYAELYGITDTYYHLELTNTNVRVTIGIAPLQSGKSLKCYTLVTKHIEDDTSARACIPKIHASFISMLYREAKKDLYTVPSIE